MSIEALPCIVCRTQLVNVDVGNDNQPSEGTAFHTYGHYGSTVFDPMDGTALEINVCDECLTAAGRDGIVNWNQRFVRLYVDLPDDKFPLEVGRQWVHRPMVPWKPGLGRDDEQAMVELSEVGTEMPQVEWRPDWQLLLGGK